MDTSSPKPQPQSSTSNYKTTLSLVVVAIAVASLAYRLLGEWGLQHTSLLFIGIPTLITLLIIKYVPSPKTAYGTVFLTITLFLLISSIILGEGTICVIMAAPIFYAVAAVIIFFIEVVKHKLKKNKKQYSFALIPLLLLMGQAYDFNTTPKTHTVESTVIVTGNPQLIQLNQQQLDLFANYPSFFKMGFPKPVDIQGQGIELGAQRHIQFLSETRGIGTLQLEVVEKSESELTFKIVDDNTHMARWLTWKQAHINISPINEQQSQVTWTMQFSCNLAPSWYFLPIEKYAIDVMNQHLIHVFFKRAKNY